MRTADSGETAWQAVAGHGQSTMWESRACIGGAAEQAQLCAPGLGAIWGSGEEMATEQDHVIPLPVSLFSFSH